MSKTIKKIGKVLVVAAGIAAVGFAVKTWLEGRKELEELQEEDLFEEESSAELHQEKALAEAKTVELSGVLPNMSVRAIAAAVTYDLSNTVMDDDRMIDVEAYGASVRIECPIGVRVQMTGEGALSSLLCNAPVPEEQDVPTLYVHVSGLASAVFVK